MGLLSLRLVAVDGSEVGQSYRALRRQARERLERQLAVPVRDGDDWSIALTANCDCADCQVLNAFLTASTEREKVWPLAKPRRQHIHGQIDNLGVPVTHCTRREGSPHRLVLTKTDQLHQREAIDRDIARQTLERLADSE